MTEFNTDSFLLELDTFGQPPPMQKIHNTAAAKEIAHKLDAINLDKKKRAGGSEVILPSSQGMISLGQSRPPTRVPIDGIDATRLRRDVLYESRPRAAPTFEMDSTDKAREYARRVAQETATYKMGRDQSPDNSDNTSSSSFPSPPPSVVAPKTSRHVFPSSDYSSASSTKSPSPAAFPSRDLHSSPSPQHSHSSYSDYASLYKNVTGLETLRPESPTQAFNQRFRQVPAVTVDDKTRVRFSPIGSTNGTEQPTGTAPKFEKAGSDSHRSHWSRNSPGAYGLRQQTAAKPPAPPTIDRTDKWRRMQSELTEQDNRFDRLTDQVRQDLAAEKSKPIGTCAGCERSICERDDRYAVQDRLYHDDCFVCDVCGRQLKEQQFHVVNGRFFCKQDYLYRMETKKTRCAGCKGEIHDMILTALNRPYHPECFTCSTCRKGLDGVPFALDKENSVYCLPCYSDRYAPRCYVCTKPILPTESGETVRIVAMQKDYHVECYCCEGCHRPLSEDSDARCYPLDGHLLCEDCHVHWRKNPQAPITDL